MKNINTNIYTQKYLTEFDVFKNDGDKNENKNIFYIVL